MKSKGKEVAGKGYSGKRKRNDTPKSGGRKKKTPGVVQFFDVAADVADKDDVESEASDFDADFMDDFVTEAKEKSEPGKAHHIPFLPKEEELSDEELERLIEERYRPGSRSVVYAEDDYETKRPDGKNSFMPSAKDPTIWKVKCMVGRERNSAFCLMQKYVDLQFLGNKLQIISAFALEHMKGYIYVEADRECDVTEACKGLCSIYSSRMAPVPKNEVSHLLSVRSKYSEVSKGTWARLKYGKYKGDLAQVVTVNDERKRATVKLIPRIDLQSLAKKFCGGVIVKQTAIPAPKLIRSSELEDLRPYIQCRRDRDTGEVFEVIDDLMLKDGYLYKKVSIESLNCWGVVPSVDELQKFKTLEKDASDDLEWLSRLYGEERKSRITENDKVAKRLSSTPGSDKGGKGLADTSGSDKGAKGLVGTSGSDKGAKGLAGTSGSDKGAKGSAGTSGSKKGNSFELHDLVFIGRKDFGVIISMEDDDSFQILKDGTEGAEVVTVKLHELKNGSLSNKFTSLDQHMKTVSVNDTVRVLEGPSKGKQGIVKQIYRGTIFIYDENQLENDGYFCAKSQMCENTKHSKNSCHDNNDDGSGPPGFQDSMASPKSPLSPKKPWEARENNRDFGGNRQGDRDGIFAIGQTLRIKVGPLKGYLCRVIAIRRSDVTVKLDSQLKVLTVKCEHLSEARMKSYGNSVSDDPESDPLKSFDQFGSQELSKDWMGGTGAPSDSNGWNLGVPSTERNSWPDSSASGFSFQLESTFGNIFGSTVNDPKKGKDEKDDAWGSKGTSDQNSSWNKAASGNQQNAWDKGKDVVRNDGAAWGRAVESSGEGNTGKADQEGSWGKAAEGWRGKESTSGSRENWNNSTAAGEIQAGDWGNTGKANQEDSRGKAVEGWGGKESSSGSRANWNNATATGENQTGGWGNTGKANQEESWGKAAEGLRGKEISSGSRANWNNATAAGENQTGGWGNTGKANQEESWGKAAASLRGKEISSGSRANWNNATAAGENQTGGWGNTGKANQENSLGKTAEGWRGNEISSGSRANSNNATAAGENRAGGWDKAVGSSAQSEEKYRDQASNWNKTKDAVGGQTDNWGNAKHAGEGDPTGLGKSGLGNQVQTDSWNKPKVFGADGGSDWNKKTPVTTEDEAGGRIDQKDSWNRPKSFGGDRGFDWNKGNVGNKEDIAQHESWSSPKTVDGDRGTGGRRGRGGNRGGRDNRGRSFGRGQSSGNPSGWNNGQADGWSKAEAFEGDQRPSWDNTTQDAGGSGNQDGWNGPKVIGEDPQDRGSSWSKERAASKEVGGSGNNWNVAKSFAGDRSSNWKNNQGELRDGDKGFGGNQSLGGKNEGSSWNESKAFGGTQSSEWNKGSLANDRSGGSRDQGDGWNSSKASVGGQGTGWKSGTSNAGGKESSGLDNKSSDWNTSKASSRNQLSGWNQGSTGCEDGGSGDQGGGWNKRKIPGEDQGTSWKSQATDVDGTQSSGWNNKGNWDAPKASGNNISSGLNQGFAANEAGGSKDQGGGWNSGSSFGGDQPSNWNKGTNAARGSEDRSDSWNRNTFGNKDNGGNWRGGRSFGRGRSSGWSRGPPADNEAGDPTGFSDRPRGGFSRGQSIGSNRGGFGNRGRGRRDQSGGWNSGKASGEDQPFSWNKGTTENGGGWGGKDHAVGWNQGGGGDKGQWQGSNTGTSSTKETGGASNQAGGWNTHGSGWNQSKRAKEAGETDAQAGYSTKGFGSTKESDGTTERSRSSGWNSQGSGWNRGTVSTNEAGGSRDQRNNCNPSHASNEGQRSGWNQSASAKEGGGWNKGQGLTKEAGETSNQAGGWNNQGSGWNTGTPSTNKGGGTGNQGNNWNQSSASDVGQSSGWNQSTGAKPHGSTKETGGTSNQAGGSNSQGSGWNRGTAPTNNGGGTGNQAGNWNQSNASDGGQSSGWNQSTTGAKGAGGSGDPVDPSGKEAASSWGKAKDGSSKGGW